MREIGAASAAYSPLPSFFFPTPPPLFGGGRRNGRPPGAVSSNRRRCLLGLWVFCSFLARSGQTAQSWARRAARSLAGAWRRLRNQIGRSRPPPQRRRVIDRFFTSRETAAESTTKRKLSRPVRDRVLGQSLCEHLATLVRTPRSRSRSEVLVRPIRSHLPIAGSSSAGLSARQKHAGRAATGRRRELGLAREQNEERTAALAMRVAGWGGARVGMAIRRPRLL